MSISNQKAVLEQQRSETCFGCIRRNRNKIAPLSTDQSTVAKSSVKLPDHELLNDSNESHPVSKSRPTTSHGIVSSMAESISNLFRSHHSFSFQDHLVKDGKIRIWVGTWNMHGEQPPDILAPFIRAPTSLEEDYESNYHILAIGTQECERSIERSIVYPSKGVWEQKLKSYLNSNYTMIKSETLAAIHLCIFVVHPLVNQISDIESGSVATGIGNIIGNKGGVGIGFMISHKISLLFITAHFTAHQTKVQERNNDFKRICKELRLKGFLNNGSDDVTERYNITIWSGDLNYRVNGTRAVVDELLTSKMMEVLLANDQLWQEMLKENAFKGFKEAPITFPPTYKFDMKKPEKTSRKNKRRSSSLSSAVEDPGEEFIQERPLNSIPESSPSETEGATLKRKSSVYDSSKKQRIPSWTDRILFKDILTDKRIIVQAYGSYMEIEDSDHKPVYAQLFLPFEWHLIYKNNKASVFSLKNSKTRHCLIL